MKIPAPALPDPTDQVCLLHVHSEFATPVTEPIHNVEQMIYMLASHEESLLELLHAAGGLVSRTPGAPGRSAVFHSPRLGRDPRERALDVSRGLLELGLREQEAYAACDLPAVFTVIGLTAGRLDQIAPSPDGKSFVASGSVLAEAERISRRALPAYPMVSPPAFLDRMRLSDSLVRQELPPDANGAESFIRFNFATPEA